MKAFDGSSYSNLPGKTFFLYYALAMALKLKRPIIWVVTQSRVILFTKKGHQIINMALDAYDFPANTLVLCDSNDAVHSPPDDFLAPDTTFFIVQVTSPAASRWGWASRRLAETWPMSLWTWDEMRTAG